MINAALLFCFSFVACYHTSDNEPLLDLALNKKRYSMADKHLAYGHRLFIVATLAASALSFCQHVNQVHEANGAWVSILVYPVLISLSLVHLTSVVAACLVRERSNPQLWHFMFVVVEVSIYMAFALGERSDGAALQAIGTTLFALISNALEKRSLRAAISFRRFLKESAVLRTSCLSITGSLVLALQYQLLAEMWIRVVEIAASWSALLVVTIVTSSIVGLCGLVRFAVIHQLPLETRLHNGLRWFHRSMSFCQSLLAVGGFWKTMTLQTLPGYVLYGQHLNGPRCNADSIVHFHQGMIQRAYSCQKYAASPLPCGNYGDAVLVWETASAENYTMACIDTNCCALIGRHVSAMAAGLLASLVFLSVQGVMGMISQLVAKTQRPTFVTLSQTPPLETARVHTLFMPLWSLVFAVPFLLANVFAAAGPLTMSV